ncbi:MAG: glyceraldehyde-3-phosphate dehydrogenase [Bacteroidota bacterium]
MQLVKTEEKFFEKELSQQAEKRKAAVEFIKIVNDLWFDKSIELLLFRNQLMDINVSEVLNLQEYARKFVNKPINIHNTLSIAKEIAKLNLHPSRIDIGKLAYEHALEEDKYETCAHFVMDKLVDILKQKKSPISPKDVVLYGFGRIGRLLARELMLHAGRGEQLRLRAIVTRGVIDEKNLEKRAALLRNDSVHGHFPGTVVTDIDKKALIIDGTTVFMISADNPDKVDYTKYGINDALVIDNSGAFRNKSALGRHLKSKGAAKVLLTAPAKGVPNIVYGVNHEEFNNKENDIWSAASCTTNAISPVLKVIEDNLGVEKGHVETIHSYTNDQNLVDNMHGKYRRGRAAAVNMVITETGAGKAVSKAIPSLEGKLTSNAIRVPVPNGSLAILNLNISKETNIEDLNNLVKKYSLDGKLVEQIKFSLNNELVSSDIIGAPTPAIFDSPATIVSEDGKNIVLYVWYDNEYGYSRQVIRLAKYVANVRRYRYY